MRFGEQMWNRIREQMNTTKYCVIIVAYMNLEMF